MLAFCELSSCGVSGEHCIIRTVLIVGLAFVESFLKQHAKARGPMARWVRLADAANWQSIIDVRAAFPTADAVKGTDLTCFNIAGNNFRLLTVIYYQSRTIEVRQLVTHAEYTRKY